MPNYPHTYQVPIKQGVADRDKFVYCPQSSPTQKTPTQRPPARRRRTPQLLSVITTVASDSPSPGTMKYSFRFLPGPGRGQVK